MNHGTKITWLGHATFLLEHGGPNGKRVLIDPWLAGNPSCPAEYHDLAPDLILITHGHNDHIGDVFEVAKRSNAPIYANFELTTWLATRGIAEERLVGVNKGGTVRFDDFGLSVTMTNAHHSSSYTLEDGSNVYLGEPAGLVVTYDDGPTIYHAGDTCLFGDMAWIGKLWAPDVAILPIGDRFTMDPRQAAYAAELVGAKTVIGCHWGTFGLLTGTPAMLTEELAKIGYDAEVIALEPGQSYAPEGTRAKTNGHG